MQLAVLNPGGRDRNQIFPDGAGIPSEGAHAPVNYHAYAACTGGGFFRDAADIPRHMRAVLLLLRKDLKVGLIALRKLKSQGRFVAVSWKESGRHQVAQQLNSAANLKLFREICTGAEAALSSTPELVPLYRSAGARVVEFIPTPYPVDQPRWDFSRPLAERRGIFIGTREWDVPSRNHAAALLQACALGVPVTVFNLDGRSGRKKLAALACDGLRVIEGRLPYPGYLRELARCRVVYQLDRSAVPGQVAGDALLCRMPCVGGDGAVDQVAFAGLDRLGPLLNDDEAWRSAVTASQARAMRELGFGAIGERLRTFFGGC